MSRTPLPFAPDPTKWIDTSKSNTKTRSKPQRPLAGWKNPINIATPPSTLRKTALKGREGEYDTPVPRQAGLMGYLTPPTTGSGTRARGLDRLRREVEKELGTPVGAKAAGPRRVDNFWGSSSDGEAGPSRLAVKHTVVRAKKPEVFRDPEEDGTQGAQLTRQSQRKPQVVGRSPRRLGPTPSQQIIRSSQIASNRQTPSRQKSRSPSPQITLPTPEHPPTSSPRARTPIPPHVLAAHKNLCGHGTAQMKKIRSPWRADQPPQHSSPIRHPKSPIMDIENRAFSLKKKAREQEASRLVTLSSSDSDEEVRKRKRKEDKDTGVLRSLRVNTKDREFVHAFASPPKKLRKMDSKALQKSCRADDVRPPSPVRPSGVKTGNAETPKRSGPPPADKQSPRPSSSPSCAESSPPLTPRKTRQKAISPQHHKVTPPKDRSPKRLQEHAETLFAFPPPPRPEFGPLAGLKPSKRDWQPVDMHAETLLTWSLGGGTRSESMKAVPLAQLHGTDEPKFSEEEQEVHRPGPTPVQSGKRKRTNSTTLDTESLAASMPSESFPNFVHSSPSKTSTRLLLPEELVIPSRVGSSSAKDFPMPPSRQLSTSLAPREADSENERKIPYACTPPSASKAAADRWKGLQTGILYVPTPSAVCTPCSTKGQSKKRKSKTPRKADIGSQTKLAAFGFFPEEKAPMSGSLHETLHDRWEDETDLDLEEDVDQGPIGAQDDKAIHGDRAAPQKKLGPVPEPPRHPGLRAAGIAELERREQRREEMYAQRSAGKGTQGERAPPMSGPTGEMVSSDPSSDLSSSDPLFPDEEGRTARDWLDGIAHRRSSEFGSFRSEI